LFFIDIQGTLIDDLEKKPIDGAIEFIDILNQKKIPYVLVTNNSKQRSVELIAYLNSIGFEIDKKQYIDPLMLLSEYLVNKNILAFGSGDFLEVLSESGFNLDSDTPKSVVIGIKKDFNNEDFAKMIEALLNGAELIGMHQNPIYAKDKKRYPGIGSILEMLKFSTSREYTVIGKPSLEFYSKAKDILGAKSFSEITMISDDVKGDLVGAKSFGMKTIFVLSGKYRTKDEVLPLLKSETLPDFTFDSIKEAIELI